MPLLDYHMVSIGFDMIAHQSFLLPAAVHTVTRQGQLTYANCDNLNFCLFFKCVTCSISTSFILLQMDKPLQVR